MAKLRYDIRLATSAKGKQKWVWVTKIKGRYQTPDEATKAANKKNKEEGLPK